MKTVIKIGYNIQKMGGINKHNKYLKGPILTKRFYTFCQNWSSGEETNRRTTSQHNSLHF